MPSKFDPNYVKNLPDAYNKLPGSNNAKILEIERYAAGMLRSAMKEVDESLDLEKAYGTTLDLYGDMVGQKRGLATDEQYRLLIRTRIVRNLSNGDYNSVLGALGMAFGCNPAEFHLAEKENTAAVVIEGLPFDYLNKNGISATEAVAIVRQLIPAGVALEAIMFDGTFEFSDQDKEFEPKAGFGNVEQTIGGTLGLAASGTESDLPI